MNSIKSLEVARPNTGYHQLTTLTTAQTAPGVGTVIALQAEGQSLRYRLDGVDPTPTVGFLLAAGETHTLNVGEGGIPKIKVIETQAGGILNVHTFK